MLAGGISALLLQTLHPRALSGVWDHSNFRTDLKGRLGRTAFFLSTTTYGGTVVAEQAISRVRQIHARIRGTAPDGQAYAADDPELLTWVHVTEVYSFLAAYLRYVEPTMSLQEQDRYFDEMAEIASRLGATDVPRSRIAMESYLAAQLPVLAVSDRSRTVIARLYDFEPRGISRLFIRAGFGLLPHWAAALLAAPSPAAWWGRLADAGVRLLAPVLRWGLAKEGVARQAWVRAMTAA